MQKIKDKAKILKTARGEKNPPYYREAKITVTYDLQKLHKNMEKNIYSVEKKYPPT